MKLTDIFTRLNKAAVSLSLNGDGGLVLTGDKKNILSVAALVKSNKAALVEALSSAPVKKDLPEAVEGLPCYPCGCRTYLPAESAYQYPDGGWVDGWSCACCGALKLMTGNKPVDIATGKAQQPEPKKSPRKKELTGVSAKAITWIQDNQSKLDGFGWTSDDLWQVKKSRGIGHLAIWEKPELKVVLLSDGAVQFQYKSNDKTITQTAYPRKPTP